MVNTSNGFNTDNTGVGVLYNNLKDLYLSCFKWVNLPETINERFLELSLFDYGKVGFFKDDNIGFLALKATLAGELDVYYEPTSIHMYGGTGYQKTRRNHKSCVIIYNNKIRDTPHFRILDYAKRIYNLEQTIDINVHAQKTPVTLQTTKRNEITIKNIYKQYKGNAPVILTDEKLGSEPIRVLKTDAPFVADKLQEQKRKLWNECLSYIGIENNYSEKNERLTENEVVISNGLAIANRNSKLNTRQYAINEINKIFDLEVSIKVSNVSFTDMGDE